MIIDSLTANLAAVATADPGCQWANALPAGIAPPLPKFPNAPMRAVHLWAAPQPATDNAPDPATAITVAVEDWQQAALPIRGRKRLWIGWPWAAARRTRS